MSFEFKAPELIPDPQAIEMEMPAGFSKSYAGIPYGTWSDDGSQLLCLLESLTIHGDFVPEHFGSLLVRWLRDAHHQSRGSIFDCGGQTGKAIRKLESGVSPLDCGGTDERSNGNGSLMRVLPVAVVGERLGWGREKRVNVAHDQSRTTHAHPISQVCCALYVLVASDLLDRPELSALDNLTQASRFLADYYRNTEQQQHGDALDTIMAFPERNFLRGSGFVVDALWSAIRAVSDADCYVTTVRNAIAYGNDTDTTACIAGGLAGIKWGVEEEGCPMGTAGIPSRWVSAMDFPEASRLFLEQVRSDAQLDSNAGKSAMAGRRYEPRSEDEKAR